MAIAQQAGLIRWSLGLDVGIMLLVACLLTAVAALRFNQAD
jgi:hypothetical protein